MEPLIFCQSIPLCLTFNLVNLGGRLGGGRRNSCLGSNGTSEHLFCGIIIIIIVVSFPLPGFCYS